MQNGAAFAALKTEIERTIESGRAQPELREHAQALQAALGRVAQVTATLHAVGDPNRTLANASVYLEAFGHMTLAWIWLEQALKAVGKTGADQHDADFYRGKLQACAYFFKWELPKIAPQLALLESIDTTTLDMQDGWF